MTGLDTERAVWVTGADSAVGLEIAQSLLHAGYRVGLSGGVDGDLAGARQLAEVDTGSAVLVERDVRAMADAEQIVADIENAVGPLYALVNAARFAVRRPVLDIPLDEWRHAVDVNVSRTFYCARAAAQVMTGRNEGRIVLLSSYVAVRAVAEACVDGATHGSAESMMRVFAMELAQHGVCVNAVALGPMAAEPTVSRETIVPLRRLGSPNDASGMVKYLLAHETNWLTGAVLRLDGGVEATALLVGPPGGVTNPHTNESAPAG